MTSGLVPSPSNAANSDIIQRFGPKILTDIDIGWQATRALRVGVGAQNVFDTYPDDNIASSVASVGAGINGADNAGTQPYNAVSIFGFNGRALFARGTFSF